ncbi:hypothetical protein SAMN05421736_101445 [Evansella caseinilytica]|uniref:Uncharacterized protein n=1 Tax=Evansella caseinilytica TaxID=1503961 RepID=A0A1H3HBI8_9BACI|nr:hypothetical protein SAMN05421736_101445 [Evansella caseinilytica]
MVIEMITTNCLQDREGTFPPLLKNEIMKNSICISLNSNKKCGSKGEHMLNFLFKV